MQVPEKPKNESERLATLQGLGILDTAQDERFDRFTKISARIFDIPIALISLVDKDRQWFKSAVGLNAKETPRNISFCGHSILGDDVFEVPNATRDSRFQDNPLVVGDPNIRFYAGAPLAAPNGHKLGTLCIIDKVPRRLSDEEKTMLKHLADMVVKEMVKNIDMDSGLASRTALIEAGNECFDRPAKQRDFELLLFKVNGIETTQNLAKSQSSVGEKFADVLGQHYPEAKSIARLNSHDYCVLLDKSIITSGTTIANQVIKAMNKLLRFDGEEQASVALIAHIKHNPEVHQSCADLMHEVDEQCSRRDH